MSSCERSFPPSKLADLSRGSASSFLALLSDSKQDPVTLVLGAGSSASAGLPLWNTLLSKVCATFFYHWEFAISLNLASIDVPPRDLSIAFFDEDFWSDDSVKLSSAFAEQDSLLAAQQISNCIRDADWRYLLRKTLYNYDITGDYLITESDLHRSLAEYCAQSQNIGGIISYNWDNLFERQLKEVGVKASPVWEGRQSHPQDSLPIYYPQGYLPLEGGPVTKLILAESDYQHAAIEVYSWANLVQAQAFCNSVSVFIGTSMIDPNIRRLLEISAEVSSAWNYAFLPTSSKREKIDIMSQALFDRDLRRLRVKTIRYPVDRTSDDPYSRLPELIGLMSCALTDEDAVWRP